MTRPGLYKPGMWENPPEFPCLTTPMNNKNTMEPPPLPIDVTPNQEGNGAILHIDCPSDGKAERWMENEEEVSTQTENSWLGKLGCLLKVHGHIECQWLYLSIRTDTNMLSPPDIYSNPWAYRISAFPSNYKLFAVARPAKGDNPPRKDHYLCGMSLLSSVRPH